MGLFHFAIRVKSFLGGIHMIAKILMLCIFFAVMIGVGVYARKHASDVDGFVLGSRSAVPGFRPLPTVPHTFRQWYLWGMQVSSAGNTVLHLPGSVSEMRSLAAFWHGLYWEGEPES